jgi:hypothetical protein
MTVLSSGIFSLTDFVGKTKGWMTTMSNLTWQYLIEGQTRAVSEGEERRRYGDVRQQVSGVVFCLIVLLLVPSQSC